MSTLLAGSQLNLVRSTDPTFATGNTFYPMSVVGSQIEAPSVDFNDGDYFTFASVLATPGGVAGSSLWLRGDSGMSCTADACSVTDWQDQSGSARTADTVLGTLSRVNVGVNFNPVLAFDATDAMRGPSLMGTATLNHANIYVVSKKTTVGSSSDLYEFNNAGAATGGLGIHQPFTDNVVYFDAGVNDASRRLTAPAGSIVLNQYQLKSYNASTTAGQTLGGTIRQGILKNGSVVSSDTTMTAFTGGDKPYQFGGASLNYSGAAAAPDGVESFAEMIVFTSAITAAQQQQIHSYLALKYGITLGQTPATNYVASDGSVVWNATTNAAHNKNIAGIGRDDASLLSQKQSRSINTASVGNLVTMGRGTIVTDNASNANTFSADRTFLVWGDDAASTGLALSVTGTSPLLTRMTRTWRVQETLDAGTVTVRIPQSALAGTAPVLIRSTDTTFNSSDTLVPLTPSGTNYEAAVDFTTGDYFTFAAVVATPGGVTGASLWLRGDIGMSCVTGACTVTSWQDRAAARRTPTW